MNTALENIYSRRAVRRYLDKPVEKEKIDQVIDAGRMAPSAINRQPWKFYILTDEEQIKKFGDAIAKAAAITFLKSGLKNMVKTTASALHFSHAGSAIKTDHSVFHGAPVVVFITAPKDNEWAQLDVGMCAQNMMLAAKSIGLDTCPVGLGKFIEKSALYPQLNIPESDHILLSVVLGYGNENPLLHERIKDNVSYITPGKNV